MSEQITTAQKLIDLVMEYSVKYGFQMLGALLILILGVVAGNWTSKVLLGLFEKRKMDITLSKFLAGLAKITVLVFAVIISLGKFGITIAPFIAALSALAFGASFAVQGPLSNYGAGLSIILSRPFVVGNTISVAGVNGVVQEVKLACTILTDEDGVRITIPNKDIVGQIIHNSQGHKIVEAQVGISYDSDPEKAVGLIRDALGRFPDVAKDPKPLVGIQAFGESSIDLGYRYWVPTVKYFQVSYAVNAAVYKSLAEAKIPIPYPQRDVHIVSQPAAGR